MTLQHNPKHTDGGNYKYVLRLLDRHQTFIVIYSNVKIFFFSLIYSDIFIRKCKN